jgi:hypothetical protein
VLVTCATQILDTHNKVEEKKKLYVPYNILPLDPESTGQAIMRYPEVFIHLSFPHWIGKYYHIVEITPLASKLFINFVFLMIM